MLAEALAQLPRAKVQRILEDAFRAKSLLQFVQDTTPGYKAGWVHELLCRRLQQFSADVAAGKSPRLMVFMPPRSGKSQVVSRRFPVWHLGHHPEHEIMLATYGQDLSNDLSRDALECVKSPQVRASFRNLALSQRREAVEQWKTSRGGGLSASGVGGPMTGRGAHVLLIDDPVKGVEEADSPEYRRKQKDWYRANAYTRLAPGGGILLTMTRWHQDDLAGWLQDEAAKDGDAWDVLKFPAVATEDEWDGSRLLRLKGEALHPERYPLAMLQQLERTLGPYLWMALYGQEPTPPDGQVIARAYLEHEYAALPDRRLSTRIMSIDTAVKEAEINDPAGLAVFDHLKPKTFVADLWTGRLDLPGLTTHVVAQVERWRPDVLLIEDKGNGTELIKACKRLQLPVGRIVEVMPHANKKLRMIAQTGVMASGDFLLPKSAPWKAQYVRKMLAFPKVDHDEEIDVTSQALAWLRQGEGIGGLFSWR